MKYFVVDAFTDTLFRGNPAGVCLPEAPISATLMQSIAAENNLAETAFITKRRDHYDLRWFTPETEMDLCGHATLASAFIIAHFVEGDATRMDFHTLSGVLTVVRAGDLFEMDFPARSPEPIPVTSLMEQAIGLPVQEAYLSRDMMLVVENEQAVANLKPDMGRIAQLKEGFGLIVTAQGEEVDFVSRFFAPNAGIPEDPVTRSAHSTLIPFWEGRLGKSRMVARQLSKRGGTLFCKSCGERVKMAGQATLYLQGEIRAD